MNQPRVGNLLSGKGLVWLLLLLVLILNFSIRWRLRGLPLERDEGEYAYAGQLILQGIPPYQLAWNMKFPGAYFACAALMGVFGQSAAGIHEGIILVTSLSIVLLFLIGRELLDDAGGLLAAAFFGLLCALPSTYGLAGHATHFVVLGVNLGVCALLRMEKSRPVFWAAVAGLAFGTAILMKQHAVFFAAAAGVWMLGRARSQTASALRHAAVFSCATLLPLALTFLGLAWAGVWHRFYLWTIQYAGDYVSLLTLDAAPGAFLAGFLPIVGQSAALWGLSLVGALLVFQPGPFRRAAVCGLALFLTGLAAATPGFYFRGHYFLMVMPGAALLGAAAVLGLAEQIRRRAARPGPLLAALALGLLASGDVCRRNASAWFESTPLEFSRRVYSLNPFPESPEIARYLNAHTRPTDTIAVIGSEPQLYFLADRHGATGYLYLYPLTEPQPMTGAMREDFIREIETNRPAYIVYVNTLSSWISLRLPGQTAQLIQAINDWWTPYAAQHYELVGQLDIPAASPARFYWDQAMASRTNTADADVSVFRRK